MRLFILRHDIFINCWEELIYVGELFDSIRIVALEWTLITCSVCVALCEERSIQNSEHHQALYCWLVKDAFCLNLMTKAHLEFHFVGY